MSDSLLVDGEAGNGAISGAGGSSQHFSAGGKPLINCQLSKIAFINHLCEENVAPGISVSLYDLVCCKSPCHYLDVQNKMLCCRASLNNND